MMKKGFGEGTPSRGQDKAYAMVKFSCKTKKLLWRWG